MRAIGICVGKNYCYATVVELLSGNPSVLYKHKPIKRPASYVDTGQMLDYFRREIIDFCDEVTNSFDTARACGSWSVPYQVPVTAGKKITLWIEGVVLSVLFAELNLESSPLLSRTIFGQHKLQTLGLLSKTDVSNTFNERGDGYIKAIAAGLTVLV